MGLDINLNTSKIDISEEDGLNVDLYNDNIDISDDEADDIIIEITGLKSISKFIGLEDTPLYYDNGKFFKVEDNKIIYTDIEWKDIKGNVDDSPEIVKVISDLVDDITDDIIDEKITLHNHNRDAHPYIQDILQDNYNTLNTKIDEVGDELSQEISHLSDNLNTEIENRETADNTLSETIQNETLARIEADSTLQNNIGTLSDNLNTEINNRTNADNLLREDINEISGNLAQEILNRQTQDGILQGNIDAETLARQNADTVLQNNINTLSQTVTDNNTAINNKVDGINTTLTNSINSLSNTVSSNYTTLDTKIDNTKNALDSDISDLSNTVTNNYNSLDARITTNTGNIATNAGNITTINSKIPNQASSSNQLADKDFVNSSIATNTANFIGTFNSVAELEAYSGTLTNNDYAFVSTTDSAGNTLYDRYKWNGSEWLFEYELNNSSFTAQQWASINSGSTIENINQIASNTQAISTETENRQNADNNLQSQIDAITASSDVTDIVGTYAQLQAYDTSTLPPNSIIKVLQDEHQNNETTYYRWVITGGVGAWVLIGEEGPYYTKSEADGRFVPQTRTINGKDLSNNITLDASDVGALPSSTVIPTVNNGTLDIQVNGTSVGTFTANQSGNTTANIVVPDSATWGNITGDIADQTDLQDALNDKQDKLTAGRYIEIVDGGTLSPLPSGCSQVEYITATGTQHLDTLITASQDYEIRAKFRLSELNDSFLYGARQAYGNSSFALHKNYAPFSTDGGAGYVNLGLDSWYIVKQNKNGIYINDVIAHSYSNSLASFTTPNTIRVFALVQGNNALYGNTFMKGDFAEFEIYNNGNLVCKLVPCIDTNDVACMYDTVNERFLYNQGTGTFTAGAVVAGSDTINCTIEDTDISTILGYTPVNPSSLATVATSGSYDDLTDKPYIPSGVVVDQTFDPTSQNAQSGVAIAGAGFLTSITSSDVTTALGYTPYNSSNPNGYTSNVGTVTSVNNVSPVSGNVTLSIPTATSDLTNDSGFITSSDLPTNYVTTNTAQTINAKKTFTGEKAILFKQNENTNKLGFTLYNPSDLELGAFEYRPNTINGNALLNVNTSYSNACYVGFRYWGTAVNVIAPKVATAGNYFIPTHITNGNTTVTASNTGTVNISTLLPDVSNFVTNSSLATTLADYQPLLVSGTNIKTINNNSILGDGNLTLDGLPSQTGQAGKFLTTNGIDASWAETTKVTIRDWSIT